jgi:N-acetylglutamate synthase-like GNAT family acetyltransferase
VNAKPYDYCKAQYQDCSKFLENLLTIQNLQHEDKVRNWINEAQQIENLDQLIGLSIAVDRSLAQGLAEAVEDRAVAQPSTSNTTTLLIERGLGRSVVREAIQNGSYQIVRIAEVRGLSVDEVADHISRLLTQHGEGLVNVLRPIEIIRSPSRFYVFVAQDRHSNQIQICGAIAIHVNTGEIGSLVVDRRYRRLGISRLLLQHVINVARERGLNQVHAYVRKNNEASIALNLSLGFTERSRTDRSILFVKELRG